MNEAAGGGVGGVGGGGGGGGDGGHPLIWGITCCIFPILITKYIERDQNKKNLLEKIF